jgi:hypothetical protein
VSEYNTIVVSVTFATLTLLAGSVAALGIWIGIKDLRARRIWLPMWIAMVVALFAMFACLWITIMSWHWYLQVQTPTT